MADILRWEARKTRKPHRCWGCHKVYPAGSRLVNAAYTDGGSVFDCFWCTVCEEYMRRHFRSGDECGEGEIYANDPEGWEEIKLEQEAADER